MNSDMEFSIHKLSIITVNLNNIGGLQKTFESVFNQLFSDYEYIVIDGGSTDGSVDIIAQNAIKISYWISERDNGIYHAMNKGIQVSKGEYILFLNSGDSLLIIMSSKTFLKKKC
jgi:glycosyltransferase involved in cell wall biosynthesis